MSAGIRKVVCGISGGVDSCVAALLLKKRGYKVLGVFMRNWDTTDEHGFCQADKDKEDAEYVCKKIGIDLLEANFVKEFWNHVFSDFIEDYTTGLTPNPDILCNKMIKFSRFLDFASKELKVDTVATGHYARICVTPNNDIRLLSAADLHKDQTFFLSQVPRAAFRKCLFPVGDLQKFHVKKIAREEGLERIASKKESTGICFIGKRNFQSFIQDYIAPKPGKFINVEDGSVVGEHNGIHYWTHGQRCLIPGRHKAFYVVEKDITTQDIIVACGREHPALYSQSFVASEPFWITPEPPDLSKGQVFECEFRFQHRDPLVKCLLYVNEVNCLCVLLESPVKALTPGQYAVFYKGEECLGSSRIKSVGPSVYRLQNVENYHCN